MLQGNGILVGKCHSQDETLSTIRDRTTLLHMALQVQQGYWHCTHSQEDKQYNLQD